MITRSFTLSELDMIRAALNEYRSVLDRKCENAARLHDKEKIAEYIEQNNVRMNCENILAGNSVPDYRRK